MRVPSVGASREFAADKAFEGQYEVKENPPDLEWKLAVPGVRDAWLEFPFLR
eukprot:CAMPEP_0184548570 /NCGR_PEP_ID=MMETSP0199_2-20130426/6279_1 /TAXON_ID=1112570 /ORGANISM="Thraustochytrium sp., Strain LLF1b" /LENGTH=51 /DNA_ID=CAMNT_0026943189 /DNA_START=132 /DNA_END=287 /DNA_ORIENTATION=+